MLMRLTERYQIPDEDPMYRYIYYPGKVGEVVVMDDNVAEILFGCGFANCCDHTVEIPLNILEIVES